MKIQNRLYPALFVRAFVSEAAASLLRAPFVYYASGLKFAANTAYSQLHWIEQMLGIGLTMKTIGVPMYGDYTLSGRVVGFFVRLFLLAGKCILFLLAAVLVLALFITYGIFPFLIAYLLFR